MLLCALGLAREGNYANGSADWYKTVREDARAAKLYEGDPAMECGEPITRAQAALLSRNTAEAANEEKQPEPSPTPSGGGGGGPVPPTPTPTPTPKTPIPTPDDGDIELPEVP